ncbi:MAG: hypothetical protein M3Z02_12810 [Actinomycetota bacterium]|nr:hypothetical protein [Actinomycetota bacterium]
MFFVALDLALVVIGFVVLGLLSLRLWRQVKVLGAEVVSASERLADAAAALDQIAPRPDQPARR